MSQNDTLERTAIIAYTLQDGAQRVERRRQRIAFALRPPRIGNLTQRIEKPRERNHGTPQKLRNCRSKSHIFSPNDRLFLRYLTHQIDPLCATPHPLRTELNSPALTGRPIASVSGEAGFLTYQKILSANQIITIHRDNTY
jgi:hypothetical protein